MHDIVAQFEELLQLWAPFPCVLTNREGLLELFKNLSRPLGARPTSSGRLPGVDRLQAAEDCVECIGGARDGHHGFDHFEVSAGAGGRPSDMYLSGHRKARWLIDATCNFSGVGVAVRDLEPVDPERNPGGALLRNEIGTHLPTWGNGVGNSRLRPVAHTHIVPQHAFDIRTLEDLPRGQQPRAGDRPWPSCLRRSGRSRVKSARSKANSHGGSGLFGAEQALP